MAYSSVNGSLSSTFRLRNEADDRLHVLTHRLKYLQQLELRETKKSQQAQALACRILQKRTALVHRRRVLCEQRKQQQDALLAAKHTHLAKRSLNQTRRKQSQDQLLVARRQVANSLRTQKLHRKALTPCKVRNSTETSYPSVVRLVDTQQKTAELQEWVASLERQEAELLMQLQQAKDKRTRQEKELQFIQDNKHINDMSEVKLFNLNE